MVELLNNQIIWSILLAWLIAHSVKSIVKIIKRNRIDHLASNGFPSLHVTLVSALTFSVAFQEGWGSTLTVIAMVFAFIVIYDAVNIRYQAGLHAKVLNEQTKPQKSIGRKLKENLGHTYIEALGGFILGLTLSLMSYYIIS